MTFFTKKTQLMPWNMEVIETEEEVENNKANKPKGVTRILGHPAPLILALAEDL